MDGEISPEIFRIGKAKMIDILHSKKKKGLKEINKSKKYFLITWNEEWSRRCA